MKPRIGRMVYCVYEDSILAEPVFMVGANSFLLRPYDKEGAWEWEYCDYNETWFTSLSKAKNKLIRNYRGYYKDKVKVVKIFDDYYEIRRINNEIKE